MTILATMAAAGIPLLSDVIGKISDKLLGHKMSDEAIIELKKLEIEKLKTLGSMDKIEGNTHTWVNDIRSLMRPVISLLIVAVWIALSFDITVETSVYVVVSDLAGAAVFYWFGDRSLMHIKRGK